MIQERLRALRQEMAKRKISAYLVPTADYHESEYVGEHFKERAFITGFTGSAGTAVITMTEAGLWTDGRYFVQAKKQLSGTPVTLYRMGEEGVPTVLEYLEENGVEISGETAFKCDDGIVLFSPNEGGGVDIAIIRNVVELNYNLGITDADVNLFNTEVGIMQELGGEQ